MFIQTFLTTSTYETISYSYAYNLRNTLYKSHLVMWHYLQLAFRVIKSCISCNSVASDIILSVLSVNSEVPVRLNLLPDVGFTISCCVRDVLRLFLRTDWADCCCWHGIRRMPPFFIHLVWNNCLQPRNIQTLCQILVCTINVRSIYIPQTELADKIRISANVLIIQYLQQTFPTFSYITRGHT